MNALRYLFLTVGIACMVLFLFYQKTTKLDANGEVIETEICIGFPTSPWYHRVDKKDRGFVFETNMVTFSALFLIAGLGSFDISNRLNRPKPPTAATQS